MMIQKIPVIPFLILAIFFFQSCQKEPEAHFSVESPVEVRENVKISNTSKDAYWYEWCNGDGHWSSETNPSWSYNQVGTYEIVLIAYSINSKKSSQATQSVVVNPNATVANFVANRTKIAENQSVHFDDLSTNTPTSWSWVFGDGSTATIQNVTHVYTTKGIYTVSLIASNVSGSDVETKVDYIIVSKAGSAPVANFAANQTIIATGETINFTDLSTNTPTSWSWDFGDGGTSTAQNPSYTYLTVGTYTISLIATNSNGSDTETKINYIRVGSVPVANFTVNQTTITEGLMISFTDLSTNTPTSWSWDFGDGGTSTAQNPSHTYSIAGTYTVSLTASNAYGSHNEIKNNFITIYPSPWTQKADFGGTTRHAAVGFSIGGKGYIGTGYDNNPQRDFWEYDTVSNTWTQMADYGGAIAAYAVGFSIDNKGYIGTAGWMGDKREFWEYDPAANTWTKKADFGGTGRMYAVGFSIGNKGYIGTGEDSESFKKDFWEYDPAANTWTKKADFGGTARGYAVGFSIGNKGYIGTGEDSESFKKDFWEYDPAANTWTKKADFGGTARGHAVGFSIGNKGYIGTGDHDFKKKDFWEYDPVINTWTQKTDAGSVGRSYAVGFSIGNKGYIGTGWWTSVRRRDFWEYTQESNPPKDNKN